MDNFGREEGLRTQKIPQKQKISRYDRLLSIG